MKKRAKRASGGKKFAPGEHIRVVPPHQPAVPVAPAGAKFTYRGGRLIPNVEVFTIFWRNLWQSSSANLIQNQHLLRRHRRKSLDRSARGIQRTGPSDWAWCAYRHEDNYPECTGRERH